MKGLRYPTGPESPETYWGRRILVIVAFLIIVSLIAWVIGRFTGNNKNEETGATPSLSASSDINQSADETTPTLPPSEVPSETPSEPPAETPIETPTETPIPPCSAQNIKVSLKGSNLVEINSTTVFDVGLTNATPQACVLDLTENRFDLTIMSGTDRIWSTTDCPEGTPTGSITLQPAEPQTFQISWPTKRSSAQCELSSSALKAGTYVATASLANQKSEQQVMRLYWK